MQYARLTTLRSRLHAGAPLPFDVLDPDGTLLLARGQTIASQPQLDALLERGALVNLDALLGAREQVAQAPREALPRLWRRCFEQVTQTLAHHDTPDFAGALDDAAQPVQLLVERDPDLAIFQVLRQDAGADMAHGVRRSLQTAITAMLVAQRLAWTPSQCQRMFKVALTMNISMLALQGELARQDGPPTPAQRAELRTHPMRSVQMLHLAGVRDDAWLEAVLRHHEQEDGSGYPAGCTEVGDLASLARRADVYTSKLAARSTREALAADVAGREMFMREPGHPMTAALVKEFGLYPPGCWVRLASGATAIVVARGPAITTPVVACLTDGQGRPLPAPERRDTTERRHAVVAVTGEGSAGRGLSLDRLLALVTAPQ